MEDHQIDPKEFLLFALKHFNIGLEKVEGKYFHLEHGYLIEVEGPSLFKLMHEGYVIAPFSSVEQLCEFIKKDIELNHG
jgi:hypothetical protein